MAVLKIKVEQLDSGEFRVSTSKDGVLGWTPVGVTFPAWVLARSVAVSIANAWKPGGRGFGVGADRVVEIIDETASRAVGV